MGAMVTPFFCVKDLPLVVASRCSLASDFHRVSILEGEEVEEEEEGQGSPSPFLPKR